MTTTKPPMPAPPRGYQTCRVLTGWGTQVSHLVRLGPGLRGTPGPTLCGLTRFDDRDGNGRSIPGTADLPGWSMGGGLHGPTVTQVRCPGCWFQAVGL